MSEVIWAINGVPAADLGIRVAGGEFRTQGVSHALLDVVADFDAAAVFTYGEAVSLTRDGVIVFQGKIAPVSKRADPAYEGHEYPVEDAWADLERTTYQEEWAIGSGAYFLPTAVLGLDSAGELLTIGEQIAEVINYAADVGVNIVMGTVPGGEVLWPKEVSNISCAEVINQCLEFHPDWVPWLDHSTSPPTFNVTTTAAMETVALATDGSGLLTSFAETERADLVPAAVRLVYEYAVTIDNEVFRNAALDKWPAAGPDGGPQVLCATIPLAGGQMQMQKSRVRVRVMPADGETGPAAKKWVKANYPRLKDVDLEDFELVSFKKALHAEDLVAAPHPPEISARALRLVPEDADEVPNQLLEGTVEDWMRKKVGWVDFSVVVRPTTGASAEVQAKINLDFPPGRCVCTNAVSKIYKGITQWVDPEDVPEGIAEAVYNSMSAAYLYQGRASLAETELSATRYHGKKLTLTGAGTAGAMIHTVSWDVGTGETTLGFGPVPELAPADFLELQRRLASRKVKWWSGGERASPALGGGGSGTVLADQRPSAAGDSVGGYHGPQLIFDAPVTAPFPFAALKIVAGGVGFNVTLQPGWVREVITITGEAIAYHMPTVSGVALNDPEPPAIGMVASHFLFVKFLTDKQGNITDPPTMETAASVPASTHYQPVDGDASGSGGVDGTYHVIIGQLIGGEVPRWLPYVASDVVHFHELWTANNLGTAGYVFKKRNAATNEYEFRSIKGRYGVVEEEMDEKIELDFDGENIGDGVGVWFEPEVEGDDPLPDEAAQFRSLRGLRTDEDPACPPQITVEASHADGETEGEPKTILVRGNGNNKALIFRSDDASGTEITRMAWRDGLVAEADDVSVVIPTVAGGNLNLSIKQWVEDTDGWLNEGSVMAVLYWRNGLFVGNADPGGTPGGLIEEVVAVIEQVS